METWHAVVRTPYKEIVWRTIWISAATTFLCIVLSLPCAYAIARMKAKWRAIVAGLIMLPFWTSFIVRVFAWRTLLNPDGFLQHALVALGLCTPETMLNYNSGAILVVSVYSFLPFAIMPIYTAAEKFDFSLLEAAYDLGAKPWRVFWRIFVPGVRAGIVGGIILRSSGISRGGVILGNDAFGIAPVGAAVFRSNCLPAKYAEPPEKGADGSSPPAENPNCQRKQRDAHGYSSM
jgi:spermidine/putrescine transport system permease protein